MSESQAQDKEVKTMSQPHYGRAYGGSPPENYERYFVPTIGMPVANDLIAVAALRPGERVLDVACGTGVVARLASQRVGAAGTVAGLDVNPGMLAAAASATSKIGRASRRGRELILVGAALIKKKKKRMNKLYIYL